jgi:hypothetical protein
MQKYKFGFWHEFCPSTLLRTVSLSNRVLRLIFVLVLGLCANLWASDKGSFFKHQPNWMKDFPLLQSAIGRSLPAKDWQAGASGGGEAKTPLLPDLLFSQKMQHSNQAIAGTGAISGQVTKAAGGDPISNVVITASQLTCPYHSFSDTSGSDGLYLISGLPCGRYAVRSTNDSVFVDVFWNNKPVGGTPDTVMVSSNDTTENINLSLRVGGKITGTITLSGSFFVLATFVFAIDTTSMTTYYDMPVSYLGGTASYTIKRLSTGAYKLRTFNYLMGYIDVYYNNKSSWATADPVSVTEGSTTPSKNFTLSSGGKIEGNVSSVGKAPLDSVLVLGVQLLDSLEWFQFDFTNANGNYSLSGLRSGYWKVFALGDTTYTFEFYNNKDTWSSADSILVTAPSTVTGKDFALEVGGSISGHAYDLGGNPLSNCTVAAYESSLVQLLSSVGIPLLAQEGISLREDNTTDDGSYKITGLRTGDYYVEASTECDNQWYDHKPTWEQADLVFVIMPDETSSIDFNLLSTFIRGDANYDGVINSADVVYLINYLFKGGPAPVPLEAGDVNLDGIVNSADVVYLINYLFKGGPTPGC